MLQRGARGGSRDWLQQEITGRCTAIMSRNYKERQREPGKPWCWDLLHLGKYVRLLHLWRRPLKCAFFLMHEWCRNRTWKVLEFLQEPALITVTGEAWSCSRKGISMKFLGNQPVCSGRGGSRSYLIHAPTSYDLITAEGFHGYYGMWQCCFDVDFSIYVVPSYIWYCLFERIWYFSRIFKVPCLLVREQRCNKCI